MKKLIVTAIAVASAVSVFAQGTITLNNFTAASRTHIYAPSATTPSLSQVGNAATGDLPAGTTVWTGYSLIGANGLAGQYGASGTMAELLAAPGLNQNASSLLPPVAGITTTFRTGAQAGNTAAGVTSTFANLAPDSSGGATLEFVAWDDSSGNYSTWATASVAWQAGLIAAGESPLMNLTATIGGTLTTPPSLPAGNQSFNLYFVVPEPTSFALVGLGAAALLIFRRRK